MFIEAFSQLASQFDWRLTWGCYSLLLLLLFLVVVVVAVHRLICLFVAFAVKVLRCFTTLQAPNQAYALIYK